MAERNLATSLRRRARAHPMARYDRLPPDLRRWLARAALPWSASSALTVWLGALAEAGGDVAHAIERLDRVERRMLAKDAARIWGPGYPPLG